MSAATSANSLTTTLTPEMSVYYEKVFLDRAVLEQVYSFLTVKKNMPKNGGKSISFTRQTPFTITTAALTEGENPTGTPFSATQISCTVAEYGDYDSISSLFELTSIDAGLQEKVETMGQYAGEKMDTVLLTAMVGGGTRQYAGGGGLTGVGSTDVMTVAQLRKAVKTLKIAKAPKFSAPIGKISGGAYRGVIDSYAWYNLMGDSAVGNFTTINTGSSPELVGQIKDQEIKRLAGIDLIESNNVASLATLGASSSDTGYISFICGKGAVGEVDVAGSGNVEIIHEASNTGGVANPLHMFGTIGWKVKGYVAKVLNSNWLIEIVTRA
jgi:N4-gp56 family major capsid protein